MRIEADSSVTFEATSFTQLFGNVIFRDDQRELYADRAQYFDDVSRLQAQGSVRLLNLEDGSLLTGEDLVLLQEGDDRAEEDVVMREGRPHARLVPRVTPDSTATEGAAGGPQTEAGEEVVPYEVDADLIHLVGDRLFQARGRVEITHESLQAYGDSLEFQQDIGSLTLFENARILSQDSLSGETTDVRGDTVTMYLPNDQLEQIEARGRAQLLTDDVDMRGPMIRLAFDEEELETVFAVRREVGEDLKLDTLMSDVVLEGALAANPTQPQAVAEDFVLTGDSIQADLGEGGLDRVTATGAARGVSTTRDSLNTDTTNDLIRSDWIEGDTIIATFRAVSPDSTEAPPDGPEPAEPTGRQMDLLVARGEARSFYRSAPESAGASGATGAQALELNYVIGDEVRLFMKDGEVERMEVDNPTGVYLQPRPAPAPAAVSPDSSAGPPRPSGAGGDPPLADSVPLDGNGNGGGRE
jgi:lipopolysaccharide export system protein LptA